MRVIDMQAAEGCVPLGRWCEALAGAGRIALRLPAEVTYLQAFDVEVRVQGSGLADAREILVGFDMAGMNMGVNRIRLSRIATHDASSIWRGSTLLPVCASGRSDWQAVVSAAGPHDTWRASFDFTVSKQ
jgi:hypothetical protein